MIESLRTKLLAERRRNLVQEMDIRKEMGDAMIQQLMESEELRTYVNSFILAYVASYYYVKFMFGAECKTFRIFIYYNLSISLPK